MFFVLFNVSFMVVGNLDIWTSPSGENPLDVSGNDFIDSFSEWPPSYLDLLSIGTAIGGLLGSAFLSLPVGAVVYAGAISANIFTLSTIFNKLADFGFAIGGGMETLITVALLFVFLGGFIDFAS